MAYKRSTKSLAKPAFPHFMRLDRRPTYSMNC